MYCQVPYGATVTADAQGKIVNPTDGIRLLKLNASSIPVERQPFCRFYALEGQSRELINDASRTRCGNREGEKKMDFEPLSSFLNTKNAAQDFRYVYWNFCDGHILM